MNTFIVSLLMISHLNVQMAFQSEPLPINFQEDYFQTEAAEVMQADSELVVELIFLDTTLEGRSQAFIFDTSSPHLLINSSWSKMKKNSKIGFEINGVGGQQVTKICKVNFDWQGIDVKKATSYAIDLRKIARIKKRNFVGLISYAQVKRKGSPIDFRIKQLCKWELKMKNDEPIQLAISKKKIKITKAFYQGY